MENAEASGLHKSLSIMNPYEAMEPPSLTLVGQPGVGKRAILRALRQWPQRVSVQVAMETTTTKGATDMVWVVDVLYLANPNSIVLRDFAKLNNVVAIVVTKLDLFTQNQGEIHRLVRQRCHELHLLVHVPFISYINSLAVECDHLILLDVLLVAVATVGVT
ncbi:hypothetical protein BASA81_010762 [Batrachochytrium salamandrivorans]|nr:hypothetical protein BASA81_010762 [Batrachochytrium salamandrivorans]